MGEAKNRKEEIEKLKEVPKTEILEPSAEMIEAFEMLRKCLQDVCAKYPNMQADHLLAICSQLVGNVWALQDQRSYTNEMIQEIVARNIEIGNKVTIDQLMKSQGQG